MTKKICVMHWKNVKKGTQKKNIRKNLGNVLFGFHCVITDITYFSWFFAISGSNSVDSH